MQNEKIDNLLNVSINLTEEELKKSPELESGYDSSNDMWEVVVKYTGNIDGLDRYGVSITYLYGGYAVLGIPKRYIQTVASLPQIEYMEKPRNLYYEVSGGKRESCFYGIQGIKTGSGAGGMTSYSGLTGKGVIVAVIDSGVDYMHPDFRNEDGTSRILYVWDQSGKGVSPKGYNMGAEYTKEQIDDAIKSGIQLPVYDSSGHGTHVLGIAAGNGRASNGVCTGCAPESGIIVVKLGRQRNNAFPMTTELMQAVNYVIQKAEERLEPVAVNISYGNSYGSHQGDSLLETYIDYMAGVWKNVIVAGSGNEGGAARHASGRFTSGMEGKEGDNVELLVYEYTQAFGIQIWKSYVDDFEIRITSPGGIQTAVLLNEQKTVRYRLGDTQLLVYYGSPSPYSINQEIYIEMIPGTDFLSEGIWNIGISPVNIVDGRYDIWLPSGKILDNGTGFLRASSDVTLTIPSTSRKAISVGAYDGATDAVAYFSGRGYTASGGIKPDIVAPGVDILSAAPGGGYNYMTGTSMATPFVTGAACCLMQWGIVDGNDAYMYGEKVRAVLKKGARRLPGYGPYPDRSAGWGALCVEKSIPV